MSLQALMGKLEHDDRLSGWQLREINKHSTQLFLNKDGEEARRRVESLAYEVEILLTRKAAKPGEKDKQWVTGHARFTVDPSGLNRFASDLDGALASASLVFNEAYSMTEVAGHVPKVALLDPDLEKDAEGQLDQAAEQLRRSAGAEHGVRLVAGEFFADLARVRYFNSQGVNCLYESSLLSGEFCLLAAGPNGESEVFKAFKRRRLQDLGLQAWVAQAAQQSRERLKAELPQSGTFDVVLSGEALDHFWAYFITQASAADKYNRLTSAELGSPLVEAGPGATPLNLSHNALIPWAVGSYKVDPSGSLGCRRTLIENGRLKARYANARYAQYLKQAPTGELANLEVGAGKESSAQLLQPGAKPLYHLNDFSYFEPNSVTGEFSSEIRFGREITAAGSRPVKGGSVSGLSQELLKSARFSSETEQRERYLGPRMIRLENVTLAGS